MKIKSCCMGKKVWRCKRKKLYNQTVIKCLKIAFFRVTNAKKWSQIRIFFLILYWYGHWSFYAGNITDGWSRDDWCQGQDIAETQWEQQWRWFIRGWKREINKFTSQDLISWKYIRFRNRVLFKSYMSYMKPIIY